MGMLRCLGLASLFVALWLGASSHLQAQDDDSPFATGRDIFPEGDRTLRRALSQAQEAFAEQRYDDVIEKVGPLLTADSTAEDFFLRSDDRHVKSSLKTEALRLLDQVPAIGMRQFELQHGAEADALFKEAIDTGSADLLAEVVRRYYHTQSGYRATLALGRNHLEQGRPRTAASYLQRLVSTPAAQAIVEPEGSVLLAAALHHSGQSDGAKETLINLKKRHPRFALQRANPSSFETDAESLPWLEKLVGKPQAGGAAISRQWTAFRGDVQRNALVEFSEPTSTPRWQVPVVNNPNDELLVAETARSLEQAGIPSLPSMHALAVQGFIIMRGPDRLVAVDMHSGKRVWEPFTETQADRPTSGGIPSDATTVIRSNQLKQRIWDDAPIGQLSSDGELLYYVGDLGDAPAYGGAPRSMLDPFSRVRPNPTVPKATNRLYAVSLQKQGKLEWEVPSPLRDDPLRDAFFLGAPLAVGGQLFVMAEIRGEIALVSLDPRTGALKWKQQLAHVENLNVHIDSLRRVVGASPSYADGVLVCPTSAGAVVAVDVASRRLLWGMPYARGGDGVTGIRLNATYARGGFVAYGKRWADGTATIAEGRVLLTPPDSTELHCLELQTGTPAWPSRSRDDLLFVAGASNGIAVVVGKTSIAGIKLSDGTAAWPAIEIDAPNGRGLLDGDHYYQPAVSGKLYMVEVASGELRQTFTTSTPLGNLVSYQNDIISLSHDSLAAYPRVDRLRARIDESLAKNPRDAWALARQGELLLHEMKWGEALAVLRQAYAAPKPDSAVRGLLIEAILALMEADFSTHKALGEEIEALIEDPVSRSRYHRVVAMGLETMGDHFGAFRAFTEIDNHAGGSASSASEAQFIDLDRSWRSRGERWIAAHLGDLYASAQPALRARMDEIVAEKLTVVARNSPLALRQFAERFSFHPISQQIRLDLALALVESNNLLEAEMLLEGAAAASPRFEGRAAAISARMLAGANLWTSAVTAYERLRTEFGDVELEGAKTGRQVRDEAAKQYPYLRALESLNRDYPLGKAVIESDPRSGVRNQPDSRRNYPLPLLQADSARRLTVFYEQLQNTLRVRDSRGHDVMVVSLNRNDSRRLYSNGAGLYSARLRGHLLVLSTGHEVLAIDLLREGRDPSDVILWREDVVDMTDQGVYSMMQTRSIHNPWTASRSIPADAHNRPVGIVSPITSAGMCFLDQRTLRCVDPLTGETFWQRNDIEPGCDLLGDDEYLFVCPSGANEAKVYRMRDGALIGDRKIAAFDNRLATNGRRTLCWSQLGQNLELRLDDVLTQTNVWTESAPAGSKAWLTNPDEVAIVTLDGRLRVRSLRSDEIILEAQLEPEPDLQHLYVLKGADQYLVAVSVPPRNADADVIVQAAPSGNHSPLFTGKIYAFDAHKGHALWPVPAVVSSMGLPLDQPLDQPVLLLLATVRSRSGRENQKTHAMCLDKRSGALLFQDDKIPNLTATYDLEVQDDGSIRVAVPGRALRIRFTEDPAPPDPPVQDEEATTAKSRSVFGAIKRALSPGDNRPPLDLFGDP